MCMSLRQDKYGREMKPRRTSRAIYGWKRVRETGTRGRYMSGTAYTQRMTQPGFEHTATTVLEYRVGKVTEAAPLSPGIFVAKEQLTPRERQRHLLVKIPKGTKVQRSPDGEYLLAERVEVVRMER